MRIPQWICLYYQARAHCTGLGDSSGSQSTATHSGLDLVSTGHQAKISQVPLCTFPARRQRPVLTPAG